MSLDRVESGGDSSTHIPEWFFGLGSEIAQEFLRLGTFDEGSVMLVYNPEDDDKDGRFDSQSRSQIPSFSDANYIDHSLYLVPQDPILPVSLIAGNPLAIGASREVIDAYWKQWGLSGKPYIMESNTIIPKKTITVSKKYNGKQYSLQYKPMYVSGRFYFVYCSKEPVQQLPNKKKVKREYGFY